jgi:hypothetical protein
MGSLPHPPHRRFPKHRYHVPTLTGDTAYDRFLRPSHVYKGDKKGHKAKDCRKETKHKRNEQVNLTTVTVNEETWYSSSCYVLYMIGKADRYEAATRYSTLGS